MKNRSYQELYDYIFGDRADLDALLAKRRSDSSSRLLQYQDEIIHKCKDFFEIFEDVTKFRIALRKLNAEKLEQLLFGNATVKLHTESNDYKFPNEIEIRNCFNQFESRHHFFSEQQQNFAFQQFSIFFKITKLIADFVEKNNTDNDRAAYEQAYKMLILFGEALPTLKQASDKKESKSTVDLITQSSTQFKKLFKPLDTYIKIHNLFSVTKQLHDTLIYPLPENGSDENTIHLDGWRKIIHSSGKRGCRIFGKAFEIEKALQGRVPKDFHEALEIGKTVIYENYAVNPALADLCLYYDVNNKIFNRCLEILKKRKSSDELPDIVIDGKDAGHPDYYITKLPIADLRTFILGQLTNCCQFIGGNAEQCVIDGLTRKSNGFYVLLKRKHSTLDAKQESKELPTPLQKSKDGAWEINYKDFEILGQCYAWKSYHGNLVIDSWENLRPENEDKVIIDLLNKFGQEVVEQKDSTILRVSIGLGGKTPEFYNEDGLKNDINEPFEYMKEGIDYGDTYEQKEVYGNLEKRRKFSKELTKIFNKLVGTGSDLFFLFGAVEPLKPEEIASEIEVNQMRALANDPKAQEIFKDDKLRTHLTNMRRKYEYYFYFFLEHITILHKSNLLTFENVKAVYNHFKIGSHSYREIFIFFEKNGILNQANFEKIMRGGSSIRSIADAIRKLDIANLSEHFELVTKMGKNAPMVAQGLISLNQANLLTSENISMIVQAPAMAENCACALQILQKDCKQITEDESKFLDKTFDEAVRNKHKSLVTVLLSSSKNINNSLIAVIDLGLEDEFKKLIANKADVNYTNHSNPPLLIACQANHSAAKSMLSTLLECKANPNIKCAGNPILHEICTLKEVDRNEKIIVLLESKANVNALNYNGDTPLHSLARNGNSDHASTLKLLLDYHADVSIKNQLGKTAIQTVRDQTLCSLLQPQEVAPIAAARRFSTS